MSARVEAVAEVLRNACRDDGVPDRWLSGCRATAEMALNAADEVDPVLVVIRKSDIAGSVPVVKVGAGVADLFDGYATTEDELRAEVGQLVGDLVSVLARLKTIDEAEGDGR